jgi:hypothetical protein
MVIVSVPACGDSADSNRIAGAAASGKSGHAERGCNQQARFWKIPVRIETNNPQEGKKSFHHFFSSCGSSFLAWQRSCLRKRN